MELLKRAKQLGMTPEAGRKLRTLVQCVGDKILLPAFGKPSLVALKSDSPLDVVTDIDLKAQKALCEGIKAILPDCLFVCEEGNDTRKIKPAFAQLDRLVVTVDPIDGTWNFARGIPIFGIILSVSLGQDCVFEILYDPLRRVFSDVNKQISSTDKALSELVGVVPTGFFPEDIQPEIIRLSSCFAHVFSLGCCCHESMLLANGSIDFMLTETVTPWDNIAGVYAARKSGCIAAMVDGSEYQADSLGGALLVSGSAAIHQQVGSIFEGILADI